MRIGVAIEETWSFFNEIFAHLQAHHQVTLFKRRKSGIPVLQRRLENAYFQRDLQELLHSNDVVFFEWASELLAQATRFPKTCAIVTRLHRYELYRWADQIDWDKVDKIILVSEAKRREFSARFPKHAEKIVVIPEGTSFERFSPQPKQFNGNIGTLCNLIPRKRVYELILAFSRLVQQYPDLHLTIGGGKHTSYPEYPDILYSLVDRLNLTHCVTFDGLVSNPEIWFRKIDIFISNSYSEGLQLAPMEAMASGIFTLSHWWDGADELLPVENLFYSEEEMNNKVQNYLELSAEEKTALQKQMREMVIDRFDINQIKIRIKETIEEVVVQSPGQRTKTK